MSKKVVLIIGALCLIMCLAGCNNKNTNTVYRISDTDKLQTITVTGTVKAVSKMPKQDDSPYSDCIISVWLTDIKSHDEIQNIKDGILVYAVALDNKTETDNAAIVQGDTVSMEIVPWKYAEKEYGTMQRVELDDPETFYLDVWFKNDKIENKKEEK